MLEPDTPIERRTSLAVEEFIRDYLRLNRPVIVTDAILRWPKPNGWNKEFLLDKFGDHDVQVYGDDFSLQTISTLMSYLAEHWGVARNDRTIVPYVRWYAKFHDVDFVWADDAFRILAEYWSCPYFLPRTNYSFPRTLLGGTRDPVIDAFPAKGFFVSAAGARTKLHADPWSSDAVLCQLEGRKRVILFAPAEGDRELLDVRLRAVKKFEAGSGSEFIPGGQVDVLERGEVLYIPAGWYHDVLSLTDSASITWNFVHEARAEPFARYLASTKSEEDRRVLDYFDIR